MSERVSGLSDDHAAHARHLMILQANLMVRNRGRVEYSQGADRMVGIRRHLSVIRGEYPPTCDCSSTSYWMHYDAVHRPYGVRDLLVPEGKDWDPNRTIYTGTMYRHGKAVIHDASLKIGDLIYYGDQGGGVPEHVALYIGGGRVFSHGSMAGPFISPLDYRNDRRMSRRYI